jgi:hypothetical protein
VLRCTHTCEARGRTACGYARDPPRIPPTRMPKQELASLAEELINLTSVKRKFSSGAESVGGPIDVALISRIDGFVWVGRKHYFEPSLNPRYFHRKFGTMHA